MGCRYNCKHNYVSENVVMEDFETERGVKMKYEMPYMDVEIWGKRDVVRTSPPEYDSDGDSGEIEDGDGEWG